MKRAFVINSGDDSRLRIYIHESKSQIKPSDSEILDIVASKLFSMKKTANAKVVEHTENIRKGWKDLCTVTELRVSDGCIIPLTIRTESTIDIS